MDLLSTLTQRINNNVAYLRRWNGGAPSHDVFSR
jgi:hypothetical protein